MSKFERWRNSSLTDYDVGLPNDDNISYNEEYSKDYLLNRISELKISLNSALYLIMEYSNLPYDAKNGNTVFDIDEGEKLTNDMIKDILGKCGYDEDLIEKVRFYENQNEQLWERLNEYENFIHRISQCGVSVDSAWGWIQVEAKKVLGEYDGL